MNPWSFLIEHSAKFLASGVMGSVATLGVIMWDANQTLTYLVDSVTELKASSYNTEYLELKYELAGLSDAEIIPTIQFWREDQKGGKLGALSTLCSQKPQTLMSGLVGADKVAAACRFAPI